MALFIPPLINQNLTLPNTSFVQSLNKNNEATETTNSSNQVLLTDNRIKAKLVEGLKKDSLIENNVSVTKMSVKLIPDYKSDTFSVRFYMAWSNSGSRYNVSYSIKASDEVEKESSTDFMLTHNEESNLGFADKEFHSVNLSKSLPYSKLKTLSFVVRIRDKKTQFAFIVGDPEPYKTDLVLEPQFKEYIINLETGAEIDSDGSQKPVIKVVKFKPFDIEQGKHNRDLIEIDMTSDGFDNYSRIVFKPSTLTDIPLSDKIKSTDKLKMLFYQKEYFDYQTKKINRVDQKVYFDDHMYYDLDKKETFFGAGKNSRVGYVIPYIYDKDFFPKFTFQINQFKNMNLIWTKKIEKPYFKEGKGKVNLVINNDFEDPRIKKKQWKKIKQDFFEQPENSEITYEDLKKLGGNT